MTTLIFRRVLIVIPTLLVVSLSIMFFSLFMNPDPVDARLQGATNVSEFAAKRHELGLDRPMLVRWVKWVGHAARLDFGSSFDSKDLNVRGQILRTLPVSLSIAILALLMGIAVGVPVGILSGSRPGS